LCSRWWPSACLFSRYSICSCFLAVSIVRRGQLLDAVECGGYEAKLHAVDDDGDVELVDPEVKAAKVTAKTLRLAGVRARHRFVFDIGIDPWPKHRMALWLCLSASIKPADQWNYVAR
ncbi:unnamed protein product, partial [Ectocarpus sp. 12 AP-2014]